MLLVRIVPILLVVSLATAAFAQQPTAGQPGTVKGLTVDFIGILVPKVSVTFHGVEGTHTIVSGPVGEFEIQLPAGQYRVTVAKTGIYYPYERKKLKVTAAKVKKFDVVLKFDIKKHPPVSLYLDTPNKRIMTGPAVLE